VFQFYDLEKHRTKPTSTHHDRHANDPDGGVIDFEFAYTP
jgi:hypothetical protein